MTSQRPSSNVVIWIVVAVLAISICICGSFALTTGGALLLAAPWRAVSAPLTTPTAEPLAVGAWQALDDLPRKVNVFLFDPNDEAIAYAGTGRYAEGGSGLYRSGDGGESWQLAVTGLPDEPVMALALSADSRVLYANLAVDPTIYASTDGARTWKAVGINGELCCNVPRVMRVAPDDPQRLYIVQPAADANLSISSDGGATWHRVADPREELQPRTLAIDPVDPTIAYLGTGGHGVYRSTDRGETWSAANVGLIDEAIVALAMSPQSSTVIYAGSESGHLYVSETGGESWRDIGAALPLDPWERGSVLGIDIDANTPEGVTVTMAGLGLMRTLDGGVTWSRLALPVTRQDFRFPQDAASATAPNGRFLLDVYYPDGEDSGAWLCVP